MQIERRGIPNVIDETKAEFSAVVNPRNELELPLNTR